MAVLFVEYPKCSTCKKAKAWLDEHGVEYIDRDIVLDNPAADELATWIARSGLPVRRFFNSSGMKYRELGLKARLDAGMTDRSATSCWRPTACWSSVRCWWATTLRFLGLRKRLGPRRCCSGSGKCDPEFASRMGCTFPKWPVAESTSHSELRLWDTVSG